MTDRFMEQNTRPTRTQDYVHCAGRRVSSAQVQNRLTHRLSSVAFVVLGVDEEPELDSATAAEAPDLPIAAFLDDAGHVEAGKRLNIANNDSLGRRDKHDFILAGDGCEDILDPWVEPPCELINLVKQRNFLFQRDIGDGCLCRVEIMSLALLLSHRDWQLRLAVLRDVPSRAGSQFQILDGNVIRIRVAGLSFCHNPHSHAIGRRLGAVLDEPFLQTDSFVSPILEVEVGIIRLLTQSGRDDFFQISGPNTEISVKK